MFKIDTSEKTAKSLNLVPIQSGLPKNGQIMIYNESINQWVFSDILKEFNFSYYNEITNPPREINFPTIDDLTYGSSFTNIPATESMRSVLNRYGYIQDNIALKNFMMIFSVSWAGIYEDPVDDDSAKCNDIPVTIKYSEVAPALLTKKHYYCVKKFDDLVEIISKIKVAAYKNAVDFSYTRNYILSEITVRDMY